MSEHRFSEILRINRFELVNADPELSELKYHFLLKKIYIPSETFQEFASSIYRGFLGRKLQREDICNVQLIESYDKNIHDLIVGFRRDTDALAIYRHSRKFLLQDQQAEIELAQAFRAILEERGVIPSLEKEKSSKSKQQGIKKRSPRIKELEHQIMSQSRSRSRETEKAHLKKKEEWAGRLYGVFYPKDWTKQSLTVLLADTLRCARNQIQVESDVVEAIPCFIINIRTPLLINSLLAGTRATEGVVLLLKQSQIIERGFLRSIKQRQLKAIRVSTARSENCFQELCKALISFKEFNLRVVTVAPYEDNFIVVIQNRVLGVFNFLRIAGWKFQTISECIKLPMTATDRWQKFLNVYKFH